MAKGECPLLLLSALSRIVLLTLGECKLVNPGKLTNLDADEKATLSWGVTLFLGKLYTLGFLT